MSLATLAVAHLSRRDLIRARAFSAQQARQYGWALAAVLIANNGTLRIRREDSALVDEEMTITSSMDESTGDQVLTLNYGDKTDTN